MYKLILRSFLIMLVSSAVIACSNSQFSSNKDAEGLTVQDTVIGEEINSEDSIEEEEEMIEEAEEEIKKCKDGENEEHYDPRKDKHKEDKHFHKSALEKCLARLDSMTPGPVQIPSLVIENQRGRVFVDNVAQLSLFNIRGSVKVNNATQVLRTENIRGSVTMNTGLLSDVEDIRGAICLRVVANETFRNTRGSMVVIGQDDKDGEDDDLIKQIIDHRGSISISKINFDLIEDTRGTLVIYDSHVNVIRNHRGSIKLVNSKVDVIQNVRGSIILKDGSEVTSITDHRGSVYEAN